MPELADDLKELARLLVDQPDEVEVQEIPITIDAAKIPIRFGPASKRIRNERPRKK